MKKGCSKVAFRLLAALFLFLLPACSHLFYYPDRVLYSRPTDHHHEYEEVSFKAKDGTKLVGWWIPTAAKKSKGTVILFHGNGQNFSSHYYSLLWLVDEGYHLFAFSYRGYGGSEGEPDQEGTVEDGVAALDFAWKRYEQNGSGKFIAYGQSLGGAILARSLQDFSHRKEVSALVLDSTFTSYRRVANSIMARHWFTWPFSWLPYVAVSNEYGSEESVKSNSIPLLVIHDQKDPAVPYVNGVQLFEMAKEPKTFWILNEGKHIAVFDQKGSPYRKSFLEFLSEH